MTGDDAETIAWRASEESGLDDRPRCRPKPFAVGYLRLRLRPKVGAAAHLHGDVIVFDPTKPEETIAYQIAHECGHVLVREEGWRLDRSLEERAASRIGVAILLPRKSYLRDLHAVGWDLPRLRELWPLAAPWIHAYRITELVSGGAVASRWSKRGTCTARASTDGIVGIGGRPSPLERSLARAALGKGGAIDSDARARAWPVDDGAIVVCGAEELARASA